MERNSFAFTEDEIVYLDGKGEVVSMQNLIAEMSFEQKIDMEASDNRNKLWCCIGCLAPEDRELINQVYFTDDVRRGDDELARMMGIGDIWSPVSYTSGL